ncbi:MAG: hypothetical protein QME66_04305 [Candidatus Eisenbacteria bacterium]|nr:hypothetical protein [Candidatus Eisenbacteria bacterium]
MKLSLDTEKLPALIEGSNQFLSNQKAEDILVTILTMKEQVDAALEQVKTVLAEKMHEIHPNLTAVSGDRVKVSLRYYGSKYAFKGDPEPLVDQGYVRRSVRYDVMSQAVEAAGKIPKGIVPLQREQQIVIRRIDAGSN